MAKASLARLRKQLEGSRLATMKGAGVAKRKATEVAQRNTHTMFAVGSAAAVGLAESQGFALPKIGDIEFTDMAGIGALILANMNVGAQTKKMAQSVADGMLSISAYRIASKLQLGGKVSGYGEEIQDVED